MIGFTLRAFSATVIVSFVAFYSEGVVAYGPEQETVMETRAVRADIINHNPEHKPLQISPCVLLAGPRAEDFVYELPGFFAGLQNSIFQQTWVERGLESDWHAVCGLHSQPSHNSRKAAIVHYLAHKGGKLVWAGVRSPSGSRQNVYVGPLQSPVGSVGKRCLLASSADRFFGDVGRFLSLDDHFASGVSSAARMVKSESNERHANSGGDNPRRRCPKHEFCPESHFLLGLQIGYLAVFLPGVLGLIWLGYRVAYRALDCFEHGRWVGGAWRGCAFLLLTPGAALLLPGFGYWFVFEGGIWRLL